MIELSVEPALVLRIPERETYNSPWSVLQVGLATYLYGLGREVENK
jgi:hypothetical protein